MQIQCERKLSSNAQLRLHFQLISQIICQVFANVQAQAMTMLVELTGELILSLEERFK